MATTAKSRAKPKKAIRQYLVDDQGRRTAVVLPIEEYEELIEALEQQDDIRHLERGKALKGDPVPWEDVKAELRRDGKLP
jgi:PHD/YefM family antitoxin component YafN of YafNO toxin-antitoxin module